jgi:hypothetical protein
VILALDPFVVIMTGLVGGLLLVLILLGLFYPGSGAAQVDWRPTRSAEVEVQNEIDDLDQMLEAANERRRARGRAALTEEGLQQEVREGLREQVKRREDYMADLEIAQMLDAANARRRERGERELSLDELRAQLET